MKLIINMLLAMMAIHCQAVIETISVGRLMKMKLITKFCKISDTKTCYGDLGCYDPCETLGTRLIMAVPYTKDEIGIKFGLYTKHNKGRRVTTEYITTDDIDSVKKTSFNASYPVKFIVHGFLDNANLSWVLNLAENLIQDAEKRNEDVNVIAVDWYNGNGFPYLQAAVNTWTVGGEIWRLCEFLVSNFEITYDNIHIIGHSLGSHIAGYAGARTEGKLGRISGLDPAAPNFDGLIQKHRLDATDAKFVDAIHTDGGIAGFGLKNNVGHLDFYPNEGKSQKGCSWSAIDAVWTKGLEKAIRDLFACSHQRSITIYTESLNFDTCPFMAHQCSSFEDFMKGKCTSCEDDGRRCAKAGYYSFQHPLPTASTQRKFFLTTDTKEPLCLYHYSVGVVLAQDEPDSGTVYITLDISPEQKISIPTLAANMSDTYKQVFTRRDELTSVPKATFRWVANRGLISGFVKAAPKMHIEKIIVEPLDILPESDRKAKIMILCNRGITVTSEKTNYDFTENKDLCK